MNISIDLREIEGLKDRMEKRSDNLKDVFATIIAKSVRVVERFSKLYSPVKTGRMRASISEGISITEKLGTVGPTVLYAPYVHARIPFMFAAHEDSIPEITKIAEEEVRKAIK